MKLAVLTAAVFPSEADARKKMWIFLKSAEKAGVPNADLHLYGIGRTFPGYRAMCLDFQLEYLKTLQSRYTNVLYSDGWDAFFTGPLAEIIDKYEKKPCPPILASAFYQLGNVSDAQKDYPNCFDPEIRYRYVNRGGYIAEIPAIIEAFERMLAQPNLTGDDCLEWYRGWKDGWFRPKLDSDCAIFQIADDDIRIMNLRIYNSYTGSFPCIWHHSGGFTDSERGKDDRMLPWAKKLEIV